MSQTLILELSDEAYATIRQQAEIAGISPAHLVVNLLEYQLALTVESQRTETEKQAARERFENHFGAVNLGNPTGADNESIDVDLAREYANNHQEN